MSLTLTRREDARGPPHPQASLAPGIRGAGCGHFICYTIAGSAYLFRESVLMGPKRAWGAAATCPVPDGLRLTCADLMVGCSFKGWKNSKMSKVAKMSKMSPDFRR